MRKLKDDQKQHNDSKSQDLCIMATGGGAFKYHDKITQALDVEVIREDEMECLIIGMIIAAVYMLRQNTADDGATQASISSSTRYPMKSLPTAKTAPWNSCHTLRTHQTSTPTFS